MGLSGDKSFQAINYSIYIHLYSPRNGSMKEKTYIRTEIKNKKYRSRIKQHANA